jgi:O-6-methylguanine DNA methyltransferase
MMKLMKAPWVSVCSKLKYVFQQQPPRLVRWGFHSSPIGPLLVGITDKNVICRIAFAEGQKAADLLKEWQKSWPKTEFVEDEAATAKTVKTMFGGAPALTLQMTGTKFQHAVWKALIDIPAGKTVSYADIARGIRKPKAARAVGTACGANPVPILVPCHRVIATDGTLGGFGGGLLLKRTMLEAERAA